jgi:acyl-coenzyme A synthetase/AMP-(fatty) acid ligase
VARLFNFGRDVIDRHAAARPEATALYVVDAGGTARRYAFDAMSRISNQCVAWFRARGIGPGDRVLVVLGKHPAFWPTMVGLMKLGAIPVPGTTQLTRRDLEYRKTAANARAAVVIDAVAQRLEREGPFDLPVKLAVGAEPPADWEAFDPYALTVRDDDPGEPTDADAPALLYFTSGTTGYQKMVLHNHAYPEAHRITAEWWIGLTSHDLHWNVADTGWAKAAWSSLFGPWMVGAAVVADPLTGKFSAAECLQVLGQHPVTSLCAPPTVYRMLVQEDLGGLRDRPLRSAVSAGEPLNPEVIAAFSAMTGLTIRDGYGQTETVLLVGNAPGAAIRPGSMGRPAPAFHVAVIDEAGRELVGEEGDIALKVVPDRPPGLFMEYAGDPDGTKARFNGDWYLTGDRAVCDEDGYLWFVGRADDVIISAGYRIGPFEVESVLIEHPDVVEAAVVAAPDPVRGEIVKAFVVLRAGVTGTPELVAELQRHVRETTAPYKYPRAIEFVDELPKTISGKIRRVELRQREWQRPR